MSLMPEWARRMTGTQLPDRVQRIGLAPMDRLKARIIRWAYPSPPCVAMALTRATRERAAAIPPRDPALRAASASSGA